MSAPGDVRYSLLSADEMCGARYHQLFLSERVDIPGVHRRRASLPSPLQSLCTVNPHQ